MNNARCLLFDLDGTLTDNYEGISRCVIHALQAMGCALPDEVVLRGCVGPPLRHSFARLLSTDDGERIESAISHYRDRYSAYGWRENAVYPGIADALEELAAGGNRLFVCTSKPQLYAERIVAHLGLAPHLHGVHGPDLEGRLDDKRDLMAALLAAEQISPVRCVMIGDRTQDMVAARANKVAGLGVLWGYGTREELLSAGAQALATRPEDLPAKLTAF
ncbi:MAG TPA: HAD hydrolase-like protein [Casimicrobiaceae bacterium]